ncbi:MAG: DUF2147 domain-containing protein [Flavobacteriales bacterium]|nr:DUF2147 domain-containing protein [Flavobacteriales bacterium]
MIKISQGGNALTLRKIILVTLAFFVLSSFSGSPYSRINEANDLIGTYLNAEKDAKVRIFLAMNNKYSGKVEWMQEPNHPDGKPKLDTKNPNPEKRDRARLGLVIMKNYEFNPSENRWEGGTIYDPKVGKTYDGYMYFSETDPKTLHLRGYVMGMPLLGRTSTWTKVD